MMDGYLKQFARRGGAGRLVFFTWIGVYPILTVTAVVLEPHLSSQPVWLQTLTMSAVMVPIMVLLVVPAFRRWM